ncbi:zinc finger BED domain-containing protein RICESLEEPER 2 [Tanacetum coccineum]
MEQEEFNNFDILSWWKGRQTQFPVLSIMARDLLSVQASTVASESAFSLSGRVLSIRRTKLTPASLEMCICLKDHLDAQERIQHTSNLEGDCLEIEQQLLEVEAEAGYVINIADEEIVLEEQAMSGSGSGLKMRCVRILSKLAKKMCSKGKIKPADGEVYKLANQGSIVRRILEWFTFCVGSELDVPLSVSLFKTIQGLLQLVDCVRRKRLLVATRNLHVNFLIKITMQKSIVDIELFQFLPVDGRGGVGICEGVGSVGVDMGKCGVVGSVVVGEG